MSSIKNARFDNQLKQYHIITNLSTTKKKLSFWQEIKYQHTKAFLPSTHESYKQK